MVKQNGGIMDNLLDILSPGELTALRLRALFEQRGYRRYHPGRFEEYRFYLENQSFLKNEQLITFNDLDGRLMALKPDLTLSIVKNVDTAGGQKKLYYMENVYRPNATGRNFTEISQMGLECLGRVGRAETNEVVRLAYESLKLTGEPFRLSLSHLRYLAGLMRNLRLPLHCRSALYENIAAKNPHGLREVAKAAGLSDEGTVMLEKASMLSGAASEVLKEAKRLCRNAEMERAVAQLEQAIGGIDDPSVLIDFSIRGDEDYYSGLMLCGYLQGKSRIVLSGGEYDNMMKKMGQTGRAIGFAIYLDELCGR
jgi:ATP phosphoribosyltransferase regulatory subunit HisZ